MQEERVQPKKKAKNKEAWEPKKENNIKVVTMEKTWSSKEVEDGGVKTQEKEVEKELWTTIEILA